MTQIAVSEDDPQRLAYNAAQPAPSPFVKALAADCTVFSTSTPALNSTYAIDAGVEANITSIAVGIAARGVCLAAARRSLMLISLASIICASARNSSTSIEDYVFSLMQGQQPSQPGRFPEPSGGDAAGNDGAQSKFPRSLRHDKVIGRSCKALDLEAEQREPLTIECRGQQPPSVIGAGQPADESHAGPQLRQLWAIPSVMMRVSRHSRAPCSIAASGSRQAPASAPR